MYLEGQCCAWKAILMPVDAWLRPFYWFIFVPSFETTAVCAFFDTLRYPNSEPRKLPIFLDQFLATPAPVAVEQGTIDARRDCQNTLPELSLLAPKRHQKRH